MKKHIITKLDQFVNENKVLDDILDKMSKYGKESLTKKEKISAWFSFSVVFIGSPRIIWSFFHQVYRFFTIPLEKTFLDKYSTDSDFHEVEKQIKNRKSRIKGSLEYDPREDKEFFKELSDDSGIDFDFSEFSEDEMEESHYNILWDDLAEEDIYHFADYFKITDGELKKTIKDEEVIKPWHELSLETKSQFKDYINNIL